VEMNKGNVEKANFAIQQNQKNADFQKLNLETKVQAAYKTWKSQYDQLLQIKTA
jgi:cobalt-zinc-cadmium efflux system outer membrane protein